MAQRTPSPSVRPARYDEPRIQAGRPGARPRRGLLAALGLLVSLTALPAAAQEARLFEIGPAIEGRVVNSAARSAHRIVLRSSVLSRRSIELPLPDGRVLDAVRDAAPEIRSAGQLTWRGRLLPNQGAGRVVLTLHRGLVNGMFYPDGETWQISTDASGAPTLAQLDPEGFPECAGGVEPPEDLFAGDLEPPAPVVNGDPADDIDVLVFYTPQARDAAGGVSQIEAQAQSAVDMANTAFIDSDMFARFELVGTALATRNDSGNISSDLSWLAGNADVAALRNTLQADMVSLLVSNGGGFCGIAYVMRNPGAGFESSAFQVTDRDCAVGNLTYAHEHGHNMGFEHDPANGALPVFASYAWSYGHFVDGSYRTVMSYDSECAAGCTRVPHFSNPDVTHNTFPTGIADERDNARTGDLTADIVANFRIQSLDVMTSGTCPDNTTVEISGASPNGPIAIATASALGSFSIPAGACAGVQTGLASPKHAMTASADGSGDFSIVPTLPAGACGRYLQVLDLSTCSISNVAQLPP